LNEKKDFIIILYKQICRFFMRYLFNYCDHDRIFVGGRRGRDSMVVGFITTYAISACHH